MWEVLPPRAERARPLAILLARNANGYVRRLRGSGTAIVAAVNDEPAVLESVANLPESESYLRSVPLLFKKPFDAQQLLDAVDESVRTASHSRLAALVS